MRYYLDIRVLPNPEIEAHQVLEAAYQSVHGLLAKRQQRDIGVSFPEANIEGEGLGSKLRLHGEESTLKALLSSGLCSALNGYIAPSTVLPVPAGARPYHVQRVQTKSSAERLRRRLAKRHGITMEEAAQRIPDSVEQRLNLPYINLKSSSTGQRFKVFFKQLEAKEAQNGEFSSYGLSPAATIPWF